MPVSMAAAAALAAANSCNNIALALRNHDSSLYNFSCHNNKIPSAAAAAGIMSSITYGRNNIAFNSVSSHMHLRRGAREFLIRNIDVQCLRPAAISSSASHDHQWLSTAPLLARCTIDGAAASTWPASASPSPERLGIHMSAPLETSAAAVSGRFTGHIHERNDVTEKVLQPAEATTGLKTVVASVEESYRKSPLGQLAARWREYHGSHDWQGLLEPLDAELRREILKYGDLTQLTYDAFDSDPASSNCGNAVCPDPASLLRQAGLSHTGYQITRYLYATSDVHLPTWLLKSRRGDDGASSTWSRDSNWMGFVAVATDEAEVARLGRRDIVVAWRGTVTPLEWMEDFDSKLVDPAKGRPLATSTSAGGHGERQQQAVGHVQMMMVGVEHGFWTLYTCAKVYSRYNKASAGQQVREEVARLLAKYSAEGHTVSVTVTGHSLGGALATLCAHDLASSGVLNRPTCGDDAAPISVLSFAAPRAGNAAFANRLAELGVHVLRIVNTHDLVPKVPGLDILNEGLAHLDLPFPLHRYHHLRMPVHAYAHAGVQLTLDHTRSPFLKKWASLPDAHNLEVCLHLVDGYRSTLEPFTSQVTTLQRHLDLVNKTSGLLVESLRVPAWWWVQGKKNDKVHQVTEPLYKQRSHVDQHTHHAVPPSPNSMQVMTA